ncbi:MAG: C45 family peptidase [Thermoplasmata archaeon]
MKRVSRLPTVEVSGKPYDMGRMAGKACARRALAYRRSIAEAIEHSVGVGWDKAVEKAKQYLPYAEEFYPDFIEEMRGYSEGAKMPFEEVFTLCCHELLSSSGYRGCTDIVVTDEVTEDRSVLAAHNEDWSPVAAETVVLLRAKPKGKPEFISTAYAGLLPSCGMNSSGISITGNALSPNDVRVGIPKIFPVRKVLEAKRIGEALEYAMPRDRASSYNNICSDRNGEVYSLEGSATDCAWIYAIDGYLVHTNHYLSPKMERFESDPSSIACSVVRYNRALKLVESQLGAVTIDSIKSILRDHVNRPGSICRHADPGLHMADVSQTIFSVVFDLKRLEAHIAKGAPCSGEYSIKSLQED